MFNWDGSGIDNKSGEIVEVGLIMTAKCCLTFVAIAGSLSEDLMRAKWLRKWEQ